MCRVHNLWLGTGAAALIGIPSHMLIGIAPKSLSPPCAPENQLAELRRYIAARGWTPAAVEYVDHGVSGAKTKRPALDARVADAKRRRFDVLAGLVRARAQGKTLGRPEGQTGVRAKQFRVERGAPGRD